MVAVEQLVADWSARHPGRGGADLVELVEAAVEVGRGAVRVARDAALERAHRMTAELVAMSDALAEVEPLRQLVHDLGAWVEQVADPGDYVAGALLARVRAATTEGA